MRVKVLVAISAVFSSGVSVGAQTQCTTKVTAVPFTINASGNYCLEKHLSTAATATTNAITINADYVTLDLKGFKLDGSAAAPAARKGIYALNRKGIVIRNGVVRGFARGVSLEGSGSSHVVEELRVETNAVAGIWAEGTGVIVRGCKVSGTTPPTPDTSADGIRIAGEEARVLNNDVLDTLATGSGVARSIVLENASASIVESNRIGNSSPVLGSTGVVVLAGQDVLISSNSISTLDNGLFFEVESFGKYRDNLTSGVNNPYNGGHDAGNNQ
jgi:nitrous oxidase accessory protein NosD